MAASLTAGRVLIITPFFRPNIGGVETRFDDICDELNKKGYSVTVLTYQPLITKARGAPIEKNGNITIYRYRWIGFDLFHKLKPYPVLQMLYLCPVLFIRSFIFLMRNHVKIEVVHTAGFSASLIGRILKAVFHKRWVVSTHAIYDLKKNGAVTHILAWILAKADFILTLSDPSRQELAGIGVDSNKIRNQITWVNQEVFKPLDKKECREKIGFKDDFLVLFIGRLLEIKGVRDLAAVARETPDISYLFIGDGPLGCFLERESARYANILYRHAVDNKELPLYYNAADIFVMPSQYKEGLGRVAVEALSCGVPVVCSNLGGLGRILNESAAVLIEPTRENIRRAVVSLRCDRERLERMRGNSRPFAEKFFSAGNIDVILNAYRRAH